MTKLLGVEFVPVDESLSRRLQTLAALAQVFAMLLAGPFAYLFTAYLILYTRFRWLAIAYVVYIWLDRHKAPLGLRSSRWVRGWIWWKYFRDYFPLKLVKTAELDPTRNYLLCCFPHGVLSTGPSGVFATEACSAGSFFPGISHHVVTLGVNFYTPFIRGMVMGMGFCSSSSKTLSYLLDSATGSGRSVVLMVGGASEALLCKPATYHILLKRRKGFVKLALRQGACLVPVCAFGETDLFDQVCLPEGSLGRRFQQFFKRIVGYAPVLMIGRGLFQKSFGVIPRSHPVTVVVGKPIEVARVAEPTQEQIDELHTKFTEELVALFEEHKHRYLENPENVSLVMV